MSNELVFLTGLSIDKKSLNNTYKNIVNDKAFAAYLNDIKDICLSIQTPSPLQKEVKTTTQDALAGNLASIPDPIRDYLFSSVLDIADTFVAGKASTILGRGLDYIWRKTKRDVPTDSPFYIKFLSDLVSNNEVKKEINKLHPLDFFKIYLSNQSDTRGVPAVAKMITQKEGLKTHWGYADRPFYMNQFIDSLEIKIINKDLINGATENLLHAQYILHGVDIVLSRMIEIFMVSDGYEKDKSMSSTVDIMSDKFVEEMGKSISDRCFFGIDLLSRIFVTLFEQKHGLKSKTTSEQDAPTLTIKISEEIDNNNQIKEYLTELIEVASHPDHVKIQNYHHEDSSDYDLLIKLPTKENLEKKYSLLDKAKGVVSKGSLIRKYFFSNNSNLLVPIKLFLSLPIILDENGLPNKVSQQHLLPDLLTTDDLDRVEVLTSGGIEHNRPLMHLINAHRMQRKGKRVFGFLDNHFDFNHRWENDAKEGFDHLFIMGIAQPVSGFNQILIKRIDEEGISSSLEAKHIAFSVACPKTQKEIVTISSYGFSALASVYATLRLITKLVRTIQLEDVLKSDILIKGVIDNMEGEWVDLKAGYSWRVVFSKNTEKLLYKISNDIDPFSVVTSPNFPVEAKELIRIFSTNLRDPNEGVIDKIHPARALTPSSSSSH